MLSVSHWNYRILAKTIKDVKTNKEYVEYSIYEVYYENDIPISFSTNSMTPTTWDLVEDPIKSLKWQLNAMKNATKKPILDYNNFPKIYQKYYRYKKLKSVSKIIKK